LARISAIVWAGVTAPLCASVLVIVALMPIPSPANAPIDVVFLRIFMALFYGAPLAIAIWWLILFNRKAGGGKYGDIVFRHIGGPLSVTAA
jgi:hypothetical protein